MPNTNEIDIIFDMIKSFSSLPSTRALAAFESAARLGNFSHAARELNTSQSAISRHITGLETHLGARLFHRERRAVRLTEQGALFHRAVVSGLGEIRTAFDTIATWSPSERLTLACTHEISHLVLLPRFEALQAAVGEAVQVHVMTYEYDALERSLDPRIDLLLSYQTGNSPSDEHTVVVREAIRPVCSPAFAETHSDVLEQSAQNWGELPFLRVSKENRGWATWEDWFGACGHPDTSPIYTGFENYVYLLEAAAAGKGLAIGWQGLVDRHLSNGTLVCITDSYVSTDRALHAKLTSRGRDRAPAKACLRFLGTVTDQNGST